MWETQVELWTSGFGLPQPWLWCAFEQGIREWRLYLGCQIKWRKTINKILVIEIEIFKSYPLPITFPLCYFKRNLSFLEQGVKIFFLDLSLPQHKMLHITCCTPIISSSSLLKPSKLPVKRQIIWNEEKIHHGWWKSECRSMLVTEVWN